VRRTNHWPSFLSTASNRGLDTEVAILTPWGWAANRASGKICCLIQTGPLPGTLVERYRAGEGVWPVASPRASADVGLRGASYKGQRRRAVTFVRESMYLDLAHPPLLRAQAQARYDGRSIVIDGA
jgi:hypothetical protein